MSKEWFDNCVELLLEDKKGKKSRFLASILKQMGTRGWEYIPTPGQERILRPMWDAHQKRRIEKVLG